MTFTVQQGRSRSKFDKGYSNQFYVRPAVTGLPIAYTAAATAAIGGTAASTVPGPASDQVIVIDEIRLSASTADSATDTTIGIQIRADYNQDGSNETQEFLFHFASAANRQVGTDLVWKPYGFVMPGGATTAGLPLAADMTFKCSAANVGNILVKGRRMSKLQAMQQEYYGSLPQIASTNSVAAGGLTAATSKAIVPAVAGKAVEILSMVYTGHGFNAAADDCRIGFWDGTTGSFTANGSMFGRAYVQGTDPACAARIVVNDTRGCIQGPVGSGVYVQASTNLAGATPTGDWIITYRYITTPEVFSTTGAVGSAISSTSSLKKFWFFTEAAVSATGVPVNWWSNATSFTAAGGARVRVYGQVISAKCAVATNPAIANPAIGLALGTDATLPISESYIFTEMDQSADTLPSARCYSQDDIETVVALSLNPGFGGLDITSALTRAQLVWGVLDSTTKTSITDTGLIV